MVSEDMIVGWDVGGAHLKAALVEAGQVVDVMLDKDAKNMDAKR